MPCRSFTYSSDALNGVRPVRRPLATRSFGIVGSFGYGYCHGCELGVGGSGHAGPPKCVNGLRSDRQTALIDRRSCSNLSGRAVPSR